MSNILTYQPLCKVCLWQAYYLHPVDINPGDLIDPVGRPNALKTAKQEEIASGADATTKYSVAADLEIIPTATTQAVMRKAKMAFRIENSGFSLWLRARPIAANNIQPFVPLDAPFKLTFVLRVKKPAFFNFTNIEDNAPPGTVYYFSNLANNRFANTNYLNATPPQLSPPQNYVSALDRVTAFANSLSVDVATLQTDFVRFVLAGSLASTEIVFEKAPEEDFLKVCQLVLRELPSGLYEIKAFAGNGSEIPSLKRTFFWNKGDVPADTFGIVELFHLPGNATTSHSLLAADQRLLSPVYTLWWQNRSTFWRYIFDANQPAPDAANPACSVRVETPGNLASWVSKERLPLLNRHRPVRFNTTAGGNNEEILLPNPKPNRIYPEGTKEYSEIFMGKTDINKLIPFIN